MTSRQVGQYMAACGFADYEHLFKESLAVEHNISGDRLLQLTSEDLRDMGQRAEQRPPVVLPAVLVEPRARSSNPRCFGPAKPGSSWKVQKNRDA
eukprot:Skav226063  [mRNA]  locus=scaffold211:422921:423484:- [translate_table: standard]